MPLSLLNYFLNDVKLDDFSNVDSIVGLFENLKLRVVFQLQKVQQLQPEVFQLVSIVFKELKVVADRWKYFVELGLKVFIVFCHYYFIDGLFQLAVHIRGIAIFLLVNYNQTIFFSIFLKLVFYGTDDTIDFLAKQFKKCFRSDFRTFVLLLESLLSFDDLCYSRIVVLKIWSWFAIVKIDQHICEITAQFSLLLVSFLWWFVHVI